jgi:DNA-binding NtrC family response regulator
MPVSQEAMRRLMAHAWPGNVRELENAMERAVALSAGRAQIEVLDLPPEMQAADASIVHDFSFPEGGIDFEAYVANVERELIRRSLETTHGNKGRAAKLLNLKRTTLVEKLKRLGRRD